MGDIRKAPGMAALELEERIRESSGRELLDLCVGKRI